MASELERLAEALADRYRVERELGRGGMALVYRAHDLRHDRAVAVKVLRADLATALGPERFLREITLTARLDHPHILPVLDSGEADGLLYFVMPYVEGESLRDRLTREQQLPLDDALQITREVADALGHAHSHGVVHRDIKPENIMLAGGHARVADFGIARVIAGAEGQELTRNGLAVGTPAYMSPEQASGSEEVDGRSDLYSLGCVLYEMLAGEPPVTGPSVQAILAKRLSEPAPRVSVLRDTVPVAVEEAIARALAKTPADRFATAARFAEALEHRADAPQAVPGAAGPLSRRRVLLGAAAALLVTLPAGWWAYMRPEPPSPRITSLAVLPLTNLMGDPEEDYFVEGMHEALTAELSKIGALKVTSRTSAMLYRDTDKAMPQIARELRVDGLIEGSVFRESDQVRVTVQLIHGPSDRHLWTDSYQRELSGILALQSDVARAIAREVEATLTPEEATRLARAPAVDPEAHVLWLKGNFHLSHLTEESFWRALAFYEDAVRKDPDYAPAHVGIALAYMQLGGWSAGARRSEILPMARQALARALALDPDLADAHAALGGMRFYFEWDWAEADNAFRRVSELDPNWIGALPLFLAVQGHLDESITLYRQALERDPLSPPAYFSLASMLSLTGEDAEAMELFRQGFDLAPDHFQGHLLINGFHHARRGELDLALSHLERAMAVQETPRTMGWLGYLHARAGRRAEALAVVDRLMDRLENAYTHQEAEMLAFVYVGLGEHESALDWLERAYEEREMGLIWLKEHWVFNPLRDEPRFQDLVRRMNFPA